MEVICVSSKPFSIKNVLEYGTCNLVQAGCLWSWTCKLESIQHISLGTTVIKNPSVSEVIKENFNRMTRKWYIYATYMLHHLYPENFSSLPSFECMYSFEWKVKYDVNSQIRPPATAHASKGS